MKQYFFTAKNIEDFRQYCNEALLNKKIFIAEKDGKPTKEFLDAISDDLKGELVEQEIFKSRLKKLFKMSDRIFEYKIFCETGIKGLRFDFNFGLQIEVPKGNYRVRIGDADTGEIFFDNRVTVGARLISLEQYFIRWHFEVFRDDKKTFEHTLNLDGQKVNIMMGGGMGDMLSILPFVREFKRRHNCKLTVIMPEYMRELTLNLYPELPQAKKSYFNVYATYYPMTSISSLGLGACDTRNTPIERVGGANLGLKNLPPKPTFKPTAPPVTRDPYVCIAVQASGTIKSWLYPDGWDIVIDYLKSLGYRVFCIDKDTEQTNYGMTIKMPEGAEDFTGDLPLLERANMLYHAEFFIGLSSGLAWLANIVNCPVVMICGFSKSWHEFYTPYRVANRLVCNGCLNDLRVHFLHTEDACSYHAGTPRELECQKKIHPRQVINAINRLIADKHLTPPLGGI